MDGFGAGGRGDQIAGLSVRPHAENAGLIDGPLQMTDELLTVCGRRGYRAGSQLITPFEALSSSKLYIKIP
jgi:hypothetical protein